MIKSASAWDLLEKYLRLEVLGTEHIPVNGKFICIANHSGVAGLDALVLSHQIKKIRGQKPTLLAHKLWFQSHLLTPLQKALGLIRADFNSSLKALKENDVLILFPEGENGNFKPSSRRYRLQNFKGGFARAALITGVPILPCIIIGAEETHINLGRLKGLRPFIGTDIPIPLNLIPLPIKWTIKFFEPIWIEGLEKDALNEQKINKICKSTRHFLQSKIVEELRQRKALSIERISIDDDDLP